LEKIYASVTEVRNSHDTHAVAVKDIIDGSLTVVGHISQRMVSICFIFSVVKIIGGKHWQMKFHLPMFFYHQSFVLYGIVQKINHKI